MWHHYPYPLEVVIEDTSLIDIGLQLPTSLDPYNGVFNVRLRTQGPPDGTPPSFPAGTLVHMTYYRVTYGRFGEYWSEGLQRDESGGYIYPPVFIAWVKQEGYPGGNEYIDDNGKSVDGKTTTEIGLDSITWTEIPTPPPHNSIGPWVKTWQSSIVLTMPGTTWEESGEIERVVYPNTDEFGNETGGGYVSPGEKGFSRPTYSVGPFFTDLSGGSVSAIAASCGLNNWKQYPTGFLTYGSNNYLGLLGSLNVFVKAINIAAGFQNAGFHGRLYCDYFSEGLYYKTSMVSASTALGYTEGDYSDPYIRPAGYTLSAQTSTSRTWSKSETDYFTITLSDPFDFNQWKEDQYPLMYEYQEPDPNNPLPDNKDRRWLDATDFGDFIIARDGAPACASFEFTGVTRQQLQGGDTDSHWRLMCGTVSGDAGTHEAQFYGEFNPDEAVQDIPSELGSATLYCWNKDSGVVEKTVGFNRESCYLAYPGSYEYGVMLLWGSESLGEDTYPLAIKSLSGQIATGLAEGTGLYTINNLRYPDPIYPRIPVPTA